MNALARKLRGAAVWRADSHSHSRHPHSRDCGKISSTRAAESRTAPLASPRQLSSGQWLLLGVVASAIALTAAAMVVDVRIFGRSPHIPFAVLAVLGFTLVAPGRAVATGWRVAVSSAGVLVALGIVFDQRLAGTPSRGLAPIVAMAGVAFLIGSLPAAITVQERLPRPATLSAAALLAAPLFLGNPLNGAHIRLAVPGVGYVQPSDLARVLLVIGLAGSMAAARPLLVAPVGIGLGDAFSYLRLVAACATPAVVAVTLALVSNDMGPALLVAAVTAAMLALAGARPIFWGAALTAAVAALTILVDISPKLSGRIADWRTPIPPGTGTPLTQVGAGLLAMAHGGFTGAGIGNGFPLLVPAYNTDMVFAVIGEELGLLNVAALIALAGLVFTGGMRIAGTQSDPARYLMAAGLSMLLLGQTLLVGGGVLGLIPLTGMPIPFVSVSGSNLVSNAFALGLLCALARPAPSDTTSRTAATTRATTSAGAGEALPVSLVRRSRIAGLVCAVLLGFTISRVIAIGIESGNIESSAGSRDLRAARLTMLDRGKLTTVDGVVLAQTVKRTGTATLRIGTAVRNLSASAGYTTVVGAQLRGGGGWGLEHAWSNKLRCSGAPLDGRGCPTLVTSLNSKAQQAALDALNGRRGAVIAANVDTGAVVTYLSSPEPRIAGLGDPVSGVATALQALEQDRDATATAAAPVNAETGHVVDLIAGTTMMPGSVGKLASSIAALEDHVPLLTSPTASVVVDGAAISSFDAPCGGAGIPDALARSCNPELAHAGAELGATRLATLTNSLLNQQSNLDGIPITASTLIGPGTSTYDAAAGAIGVGDAQATPLSILQLTLLIARHGKPIGLTLEQGSKAPTPDVQINTQATATVAEGMRGAVTYGTASTISAFADLQVAAKTGTADYSATKSNGWITAYAPYDHPKYAVTVLIPSAPEKLEMTGAADAGPVAGAVLNALLSNPD